MCGRTESADVPFNAEHVIPDWLQSTHKLHAESVSLANGVTRRYGGHKIPCCAECNAVLGERIEVPASRLLKAGYASMKEQIDSDGFQLLHAWAALVFLKMHLKDSMMPWNLDTRKDDGNIGEVYSSDELHHIQCIVRTQLLEGWVEQDVRGTCFVHQASTTEFDQPFDYGDNSRGCASMIVSETSAFLMYLTTRASSLQPQKS